eukprot:490395-Prymnesium_polylepis.1
MGNGYTYWELHPTGLRSRVMRCPAPRARPRYWPGLVCSDECRDCREPRDGRNVTAWAIHGNQMPISNLWRGSVEGNTTMLHQQYSGPAMHQSTSNQ